ncbi:hypothetical protein [Devosia marina]|uniref:hypothetical protein n=1 Tax=Devosia marina TaxID=2683198 RepID=UPI003D9A5DEA
MITIFGSTNLYQIGTAGRDRAGHILGGVRRQGGQSGPAARRAGAKVLHVSTVGDDVFADLATELLRDDGVDLHGSSAF